MKTKSLAACVTTAHRCWMTAIDNADHWHKEAEKCKAAGYAFGADRATRNARSSEAGFARLHCEFDRLSKQLQHAQLKLVKCGQTVTFTRNMASRAVSYTGTIVGFVNHRDGSRSARVSYTQKNGRPRVVAVFPGSFENLPQR